MTISSRDLADGDLAFSGDERQRYRRPNLARLVMDLTLPWVQVFLGCAVFVFYPSFWTWLLAIVLVAGAQHGLSMITHEGAHRLIWPKSQRINDIVTTCFCAAPVLLPLNVYRTRHLIHHRRVSQDDDTKTFYRRDLRGWRFAAEVLRSLCGIDYILQAAEALRHGKEGGSEQFQLDLRRDQRSIVVAQTVLFLIFLLFDPLYHWVPTYYFILWLAPLLTLSFLFGKLRSVVEHQPPNFGTVAAQDRPYFLGSNGPLLRSVHATWFERFFLSKINFHYHAEHHLWPWISYQYLPEVNSRVWHGVSGPQSIKGNHVILEESYASALGRIIRGN
jgi:fatty acid desaturase